MSPDREQVVLKLRQDHEYMVELMHRITGLCARREAAEDCNGCPSGQRGLCHDNIEQLIRTFVEVTLRHNLIESAYMAEIAPPAHRIAHNRAHLEIAEQMKAIRVVFAQGGNGIAAIDGIDQALETIAAHLVEFDKPLEQYLLDAA